MTKTISEAIVQSKFRNDYHKATVALFYVCNQVGGIHHAFFKNYNITLQQFNVLRILRGQQPNACNLLLIKERMMDKMSDVSRIVERLRIAGYVDRCLNENNRREVEIRISKNGLKLLAKIDQNIDVLETPLTQLTQKEAKELIKLLEKIIQ
ncbi:MAG TPA: MarR family transcriptional regulator [Bacteroidia bacterium]|nr:MarR family transcriptional regulator [Bacteroidia bacterium]HRH07947.1 MarR family transcriptional regulator [Bacteroidia bacterium]HRH62499.1 MarR family transcriptional regulator [Bacteroidia bacterium]